MNFRDDVVGDGPVADHAALLREAIGKAQLQHGKSMSMRAASKRARMSHGGISEAMNGSKLPPQEDVTCILDAYEVPASDVARVRAARLKAEKAMARLQPDLSTCLTPTDLTKAFRALLTDHGRDVTHLGMTIRDADPTKLSRFLAKARPTEPEIRAALSDRSALTGEMLGWLVFGAGGRQPAVRHWQKHLRRISQLSRTSRSDPSQPAAAEIEPHPGSAIEAGAMDTSVLSPAPAPAPAPAPETAPEPSQVATTAEPTPALGARLCSGRTVMVAVAGAAVLAAAGAMYVAPWRTERADSQPGAATSRAAGEPLPSLNGEAGTKAALEQLRHGASHAAHLPLGRFACIHRKSYSFQDGREMETDTQLYVDQDYKGVRITMESDKPEPQREELLPGDFQPSVDDPSDDAYTLTQQLKSPFIEAQGPAIWMQAVATLYEEHTLTPTQRAAMATVLDAADGVTYHGRAVDRRQRAGLEFVADNADHSRQGRLLFDPKDGSLLRYQLVQLAGTETVLKEIIYVSQTRCDAVG